MANYIYNNKPISEEFVIEAADIEDVDVLDYVDQKEGLEIIEEDSVKSNGVKNKTPDVSNDPTNTSKIDNSKEAILRRRRERLTQKSSDPLDYDNYDIASDSFILPVDLEEVVVTGPKRLRHTKGFGDKMQKKRKIKEKIASTYYNKMKQEISSISNSDNVNRAAEIYFDLNGMKEEPIGYETREEWHGNVAVKKEVPIYETSVEKYLNKLDPSGNLFAEYTHYQNTLTNLGGPELIGTNSYNEKRISDALVEGTHLNTQEAILRFTNNIPEEYQSYIKSQQPDAEHTEAILEARSDELADIASSLTDRQIKLNNEAKPYIEKISNLKSEIDKIVKFAGGKISALDAPVLIENYQNLITEYNEAVEEIRLKDFEQIQSQLLGEVKAYEAQIPIFQNEIKTFNNDQIMAKALDLDYSLGTRAAITFENFFLGGGAMAGYNMAEIKALPYRLINKIIPEKYGAVGDAVIDGMLNKIKNQAVNYNDRIAAKFEKIPPSLTNKDVGKNGVTVWNYLGQVAVNNAPSMLVSMAPVPGFWIGGQILKKAIAGRTLRQVVTGGSTQAVKQAMKSKRAWEIASMRYTLGQFGITESGHKRYELEAQQKFAPKKLISIGEDIDKIDVKIESLLGDSLIKEEGVDGSVKTRMLTLQERLNKLDPAQRAEYNRLNKTLKGFQQEYKEWGLKANYTELQKGFVSNAYGITAIAWEQVGTIPLITGGYRFLEGIVGKQSKYLLKDGVTSYAANRSKAVAKGIFAGGVVAVGSNFIENFEEFGTLGTHNFLDVAVLRENKPLASGMDLEMYINTSFSILGVGAQRSMGAVWNTWKSEFRSLNEIKQAKRRNERFVRLNSEIEDIEMMHGNNTEVLVDNENYLDLISELQSLKEEMAYYDGIEMIKLKSNTVAELNEISEYNRVQREIEKLAAQAGSGSETGIAAESLRQKWIDKWNEAQSSKDELLGKFNKEINVIIEGLQEELTKEKRKINNAGIEFDLAKKELYIEAAMLGLGNDGDLIRGTTVDELRKGLENRGYDADVILKDLFGDLEINDENLRFVNNGMPLYEKGDILINDSGINFAIAYGGFSGQYAVTTGLEELFHLYSEKYGIVTKNEKGELVLKPEARAAVKELLNIVKTKYANSKNPKDKTNWKGLIDRLNMYIPEGQQIDIEDISTFDGITFEGKNALDAEEFLMQLNNALILGAIDLNDLTNQTYIGPFVQSIINNVLGQAAWMMKLKTPSDLLSFIQRFNQKALASKRALITQPPPEDKKEDIKGESITTTQTTQKKSAGLTGFGLEIDKLAPKEGQTLDQYKNDPNYYNLYQSIGNIENEETKIKGFKNRTADAEFVKAIENVAKIVTQGKLERDLDIQAIRDNLALRFIQNYNPTKNPSIFGWMTSGKVSPLRGAVLDQIKAFKQTPTDQASSFDIEQGQIGAVREMASQDVDFSETINETIEIPKSQIKQEAPQLIDQSIEDDIETAVLEIAEGVFPDVNSKEFLPFIKEVIEGKLTNKFKTKFGTREQYDNFINKLAPALKRVMPASFFVKLESTLKPEQRQFTEPPIRLTTQADIDKARDNEQINYLENDAQGVNLYKLKKFTPKELATFINPPAINPKTGKKSGLKGTRKTSVATSVATQSAFDMIPSIFKGKVSEFELAKISEKIQRDPRIKFSKGLELSIQELFKLSNNVPGFNLELYGINKLNTLLKNKKLDKTLDLKKLVLTEDGRDEILKQQKWIMANLGPKQMWFGKNGTGAPVFTTSNADYGIESMTEKKLDYWYPNEKGLDIQAIKKSLKPGQTLEQSKEEIKVFVKNPKYNKTKANAFTKLKDALIAIRNDKSYTDYGPEIDGVTDYKLSSYSTLLGTPKNAAAKNKKGDIDKFNTKVKLIHEAMWERIYKLVGEDKNNASLIGGYLKLVANNKDHWHKRGAEIVGWSLNPKGLRGTLYEYEHAMPATAAYLYLLDVAIKQANFKAAYNAVMDNYKLIALDKAQNAKLGLAGYGRSMPAGWMLGENYWWQRYFNEKIATFEGGIDPASIVFTNGRTFEDQLQINSAGQLSKPVLNKAKQNAKNKINLPILKPTGIKFAKSDTNQDVIDEMIQLNKAFENARNSRSSKGISVWDFDDTLAITKSNVLYTLPDGTTGKLSATEFAKRSGELESQGAVFDFSEFNKITKGKKGPMFQKAVNRNNKFGNKNVFILTARPNNAAKPIHDFLKALGLDIPLKNIVGLENGLPSAKVKWIVDKAAEGYNDFYFADDAYKNVKAVQNALSVLDVKSKSRQVKKKYSKGINLNQEFNEILERATGIGKEKQYGRTKARAVGADKGKWDWAGIPPSAQDFVGLTRYFAGKGKEGDATIAWIKKNFLDPFARANIDISNARVALANDYKALKKLLDVNNSLLNKKIPGEPYTVSNAIRVYIWGLQGMKVPGLSKADAKILNDYVLDNENLQLFANNLIDINKDNGYAKPSEGWLAGTITTDLLSGLNTIVRAKYLQQWQNNVNEVFTETNMNKLEAAYGKGYRDALENILGRMKAGSNRGFKGDTLTGRFIDWINGSVGAIMFFNMRSAVLQTISAVNFINWSDNNPIQAAKAFANQLQFWRDVVNLMNSDYLIERRNGLKINVNEADIAEIAAESKNKAKAFIHKLLKLGFLPTQIADSFAIATGGATFYRNRYKSYIKDGMSKKDAEAQAFVDFREISEENQQSSRPDRISAQQAGPLGRIILAFANTPAQYARLMQKAASDLKNRRGDDKTNISKILYYGMIQNVIFNALQQALFAMAFNDEEPDEEKKNAKYIGILNGMADSLLRGVGFHGAAIASIKNAILKIAQGGKAQDAVEEVLKFSPPVSSKYKKIRGAGKIWDWDKKEIKKKGWSLDNPAWLASGQLISASTNFPLDRLVRKLNNIRDASDANNEEWQRVANALGWEKWELEWTKPKKSKKKTKSKSRTISRSISRTSSRSIKR